MKTKNPKGFRDFVGSDALKRKKIKSVIEDTFRLYGYEPAETPIIEFEEFVKSGNENDEAVRDIFKLEDRGKRKLALRYEFTFQLKRISRNQKLPFKVYRIGSVFRDEPIRKGRMRQFVQADIDVVGSTVNEEAECIVVGKRIFDKLAIPIKIYVNNRKLMNEIISGENIKERDREQVMRELDKIDNMSKKEVADRLKKLGAEKLINVFSNDERFFEKYNFYREVRRLKGLCKKYGVEVEFKPSLSRGLSYYNSSVFEIWSDKFDVSLAGGGSYLIEEKQATGLSFGMEPIFLVSKVEADKSGVQIISIEQDDKAIKLAEKLREQGICVILILDKTLGKALEYANSRGIEKVIIIGKDEVNKGKLRIRDMESGEERVVREEKLFEIFESC